MKNIQKQNCIFDQQKLDWFNGQYIRMKSDEELIKLLKPFTPRDNKELMAQIIPLIKERITTLSEFSQLAGFFFTRPKVDPALFEKLDYRHFLKSAAGTLQSIEVWQEGTITGALMHLIDKKSLAGW